MGGLFFYALSEFFQKSDDHEYWLQLME